MLDYLQAIFYSDKILNNPILGKVSCESFHESYKSCKQAHRKEIRDPCLQIRMLSKKCYRGKNEEEVNDWILKQFEQSYLMIKFLQKRGSKLPELLKNNSWAIFTNKNNLQKYQHIAKPKNISFD